MIRHAMVTAGLVLVAALSLLAGCVSVPPVTERPPLPSALRIEAWGEMKRIARLFGRAPAEVSPGLAALASEVAELQLRVEADGGLHLDLVDPVRLVERNPAFWRACLDVAPGDAILPLFAAIVRVVADQPGHAAELLALTRAGPLLPGPLDRVVAGYLETTRPFRPEELAEVLAGVTPDEAAALLAERADPSLAPDSVEAAMMVMGLHRIAAGLPADVGTPEADPEQVERMLAAASRERALIAATLPIESLVFVEDRVMRHHAQRVWPTWRQVSRHYGALGAADYEALAEVFAQGGRLEQALLARRLLMASRGFAVPADLDFWRRELGRLLGEADVARVLEPWEQGTGRQIGFFAPEPPPEGEPWRPLLPLAGEALERQRRDATYVLERPLEDAETMAWAYALRSDALKFLGRWEECAADLRRLDLLHADTEELARSAEVALALIRQRAAEAEAMLRPLLAGNASARVHHDHGVLLALQERWAVAARAFAAQAAASEDPESAAFAAVHAFVASRFAAEAPPPEAMELLGDPARLPEHGWVLELVAVVLDPPRAAGLLASAETAPSVLERAERRCEALLLLAALAPAGSVQQRGHLENCVRTGVVYFHEYELARIRLRQVEPERWDPDRQEPPPAPPERAPREEGPDLDNARPKWTIPA